MFQCFTATFLLVGVLPNSWCSSGKDEGLRVYFSWKSAYQMMSSQPFFRGYRPIRWVGLCSMRLREFNPVLARAGATAMDGVATHCYKCDTGWSQKLHRRDAKFGGARRRVVNRSKTSHKAMPL